MEGPRVAGTESTVGQGRVAPSARGTLGGSRSSRGLSSFTCQVRVTAAPGGRRVQRGHECTVAHRGSSPLCSRTPEETSLSPQPPSDVTTCPSSSHVGACECMCV